MSLSGFPIPRFGGLNLVDDPEEIGHTGAVDLLNVDFDKHGRVRTRDGYDNLTAVDAGNRLESINNFYKVDGTKQLLVSSTAGLFIRAYTSAGVLIASQAVTVAREVDFTRFGGPGAEVIYATGWGVFPTVAALAYKWSGAAWAGAALGYGGLLYPYQLEVKADENRLVGAFVTSSNSRIGFSDAGAPETWGANNYVDLTPGDGERITALIAWREMVFAFKESKFFVFTNTTTSGTGTPIFNYRPVNTGIGAVGRLCATRSSKGVFFLSRRGIYLTTGGDPVLISRSIDPIFRGGESNLYTGGILNPAAIDKCTLTWHDERLYFNYPSGSATTNDRTLVYDPELDMWSLWDIAAGAMVSFRVGDREELVFTYAAGSNFIGRHSSSYTDDDGTNIAARYQSGFYQPSPTNEVTTRWTELWGTGAPTFNIFTDHATSDPLSRGGTVTLGTSPQVAKGTHLKSYTGQLLSHKLNSTSGAWSVNRIEHQITNVFTPS